MCVGFWGCAPKPVSRSVGWLGVTVAPPGAVWGLQGPWGSFWPPGPAKRLFWQMSATRAPFAVIFFRTERCKNFAFGVLWVG